MIYLKNDDGEIHFDNLAYGLSLCKIASASGSHIYYQGAQQIGQYTANSAIVNRPGVISGYIHALNAGDMQKRKRKLSRLVNPLKKFQIIKNNRYKLDCSPSETLETDNLTYLDDDTTFKFTFNFECCSPCWTDFEWNNPQYRNVIPNFHFPFFFVEKKPLGFLEKSSIFRIQNDGDVPTGMIITVTSDYDVGSFELKNAVTDEYIKLNHSIIHGDTIIIDTNNGSKSITYISPNGVKQDFMQFVDYRSTFLQLAVGENIFVLNTGDESKKINASFQFYNNYLTV